MAIANGYCTLAELKAALRIADSVDDSLLERCVEAASRQIDNTCDRRFYADGSTSARIYEASNSYTVLVDDISTTTGLIVKIDTTGDGTYNQTLTANSDYRIDPPNGTTTGYPIRTLRALDTLFPVDSRGRALVEVTANWGWPGTVPHAVREATVILSSRLFKRYDSPLGVAGFGDLGVITVRRVDPDVENLVAPYRVLVTA
jgi:hypothetical protein